MLPIFLLLTVFCPLASTTGSLSLSIKSSVPQKINVKLFAKNLYHELDATVLPGQQDLLVRANLSFRGLYDLSIETTEERIVESFLPVAVRRGEKVKLSKEQLKKLNLEKLEVKILCDKNYYGTRCNVICDADEAEALGLRCNDNGVLTEAKKGGCEQDNSCERRMAIHRCVTKLSLPETVCKALNSEKRVRKMVEQL